MPNIRSAAKRIRSDAKKRERNLAVISELRTLSKKLAQLALDSVKAQEVAATLVSRYDRAAFKGIIPKGRANRRKARIASFLSKIKKK